MFNYTVIIRYKKTELHTNYTLQKTELHADYTLQRNTVQKYYKKSVGGGKIRLKMCKNRQVAFCTVKNKKNAAALPSTVRQQRSFCRQPACFIVSTAAQSYRSG